MDTVTKKTDEKYIVKRYKIQYPVSAYTFPKETNIHTVRLMIIIFISN